MFTALTSAISECFYAHGVADRVLNCLDEGTLQLQVVAVRPGLARISSLLLEDQLTGQSYKLDRTLELFAHSRV